MLTVPETVAPLLGAVKLTVGGTRSLMLTVTEAWEVPPAPVQLKVYVVAVVMFVIFWEPLVAVELVQPEGVVAAHDVALVADQVKLELPPLDTLVGLAVRVIPGGGLVFKLAKRFL